ncbi:hypothetical protein LPJ73_004878 [Coemansia sp. RSA 2703]|nr:hypothetical protein LPJ73_004878 [Coemansia sp. RSA 2703]
MIDGNPNELVQVDDGVQTSMDAVDAAVAAVEDIAATIGSCAPANPDLGIESATDVIQSTSQVPDNANDTIVSNNVDSRDQSQDHQQQQQQQQEEQENADAVISADGSPKETVEPSVVEPESEPSASLQTIAEPNAVIAADVNTNTAVESEQSEMIVESTSEAVPEAAFTSTPN